MVHNFVNVGNEDYEIWIDADAQIAFIYKVKAGDLDDGDNPMLMRSRLIVDGQVLQSPLPPQQIVKRIKAAQAVSVPGVENE